MKLKQLIVPVFVILALAFLWYKYRVPPKIEFLELTTTNLEGEPVDINQYAGKNIFITMWAPWCADCIKEMPSIQTLKNELNQEDWVFLAISGYDIAKEKYFAENNDYDITYLHMDQTLADVGIHSIPTNYIINSKGEVVYKKVGSDNWGSEKMIYITKELVK